MKIWQSTVVEAGAVPSVAGMEGGGSRHEVDFLISITFKWHIICLRHNIYVGCVAIELYVHIYPEQFCVEIYVHFAADVAELCLTRDKGAERGGGVAGEAGGVTDSHL